MLVFPVIKTVLHGSGPQIIEYFSLLSIPYFCYNALRGAIGIIYILLRVVAF
jgi:hypothetical protein